MEPETKEGQEYTPIYPCPIANRFECPYEKDVNKLFAIQEIALAIHMAFLKAYVITKSNDTVYDTDFVEGKVNEIITLFDGSSHSWDTKYLIEEKLPRVERLSIVPIRNVDDVYEALKDGDTLAKILEQGLEEQYLSWKESIVKRFMSVKDKIKKEDLTINEPTCASKMQKKACVLCAKDLLIFIVLTAAMFGYVPTIGNSIKWKDIHPDISLEIRFLLSRF